MKISKHAWHYWVLKQFDYHNKPKDLCGYVRALALCVFVFGTIAVALLPIMFVCVMADKALSWAVDRLASLWYRCFPLPQLGDVPLSTEDRKPGVFVSWWRAKKDKVCPLIEFTD